MLQLADARWYAGIILLVDLVALVSIWRSTRHSTKAQIVWTLLVALLPILGALAWLGLGRERKRHR